MDLRRPASLLSTPLRSFFPLLLARGHKTTARTKRALKIAPHDSFLPVRPDGRPPPSEHTSSSLISSSSLDPTASSSPSPSPPSPSPSSSSSSSETSIIYNPPSSAPSPLNTPLIFLPPEDPRRIAIPRLRTQHFRAPTTRNPNPNPNPNPNHGANNSNADTNDSSNPHNNHNHNSHLPPALRYPRRQPRYHLQPSHIAEMRSLRASDPLTWSVARLAAKFDCSTVFVRMAAPAPKEHLDWLRRKLEMKMQRWGPIKKQAREDRKRRTEMLYRGEL